jgi:hypothetical protein
MGLCGEFTASTMFTRGGTAMYEHKPVNLADRADPAVIAALARRCQLCGAVPGLDCRSVIDRLVLPGGRVVHHYRLEEGK